ncbi:hypothetical protein ASPSYDRAFT_163841 [Aspergillus sydowii CBS 593.65]|uniref:GST C-terminal domain-containing protein n=1 Tax=Aspergillus sydowii CBS 593.65 TaxID=1036612 RepID=A0A1L9T057_9EURO|nr:uncharacterized protein ASPSYDRAFT_163841 [Aspergillus sydowii CBS 593.65]OJJ52777.1 hypothetical protein ASPSYDRAFT_163841 [Aspergillus sydowii CBS 593.65]
MAPQVILLELGLEFETALAQVGNFGTEFLDVNPKGRVPVLAIDSEIITEMPAILTAISLLRPDQHLLGRNDLETARVYEWLNYLSGTFHGQGYGALWRPERFVNDPNLYRQIQEKGMQTIKQCYDLIESKLGSDKRPFAVGNSFTVVDPFLLVLFLWGERIKINMTTEYPVFTKWAHTLLKRESVCRARDLHFKL